MTAVRFCPSSSTAIFNSIPVPYIFFRHFFFCLFLVQHSPHVTTQAHIPTCTHARAEFQEVFPVRRASALRGAVGALENIVAFSSSVLFLCWRHQILVVRFHKSHLGLGHLRRAIL